MDPYDEQILRNEVIFLHSLWHQGPPPPPPPPPPPLQHHHFFHPLNPPLFKNPNQPSEHTQKFKKMKTQQQFHGSTTEWPCPLPPSSDSSTWPSFPTTQFPSEADIHFSSIKVQAWDVGNRMQLKVVQKVKKFFEDQKNESDDDDDEMESGASDEDSGDEGGGNGDCFEFFLQLFAENGELREFYLKNKDNGEFGCLVCGGVGFIRRFKDCVALVQHTLSISKTKKMKAHRGFGKAVCEVLGWDINKLPSIASSISEMKNVASGELEENRLLVQEQLTYDDHNVESHDKETGEKEIVGVELLVQEKLINQDHNVESLNKETREKEIDGAEQLHDSDALAVTEIVGGEASLATKLKENAADIEQGNIAGPLDCLEADHSNGCKGVGIDVDLSSVDGNSSAETKGKEAAGVTLKLDEDTEILTLEKREASNH